MFTWPRVVWDGSNVREGEEEWGNLGERVSSARDTDRQNHQEQCKNANTRICAHTMSYRVCSQVQHIKGSVFQNVKRSVAFNNGICLADSFSLGAEISYTAPAMQVNEILFLLLTILHFKYSHTTSLSKNNVFRIISRPRCDHFSVELLSN